LIILHSCIALHCPAFLHSCISAFLHSCIALHSCISAFLHSCIPIFPMTPSLPIDPYIPTILDAVRRWRAVVVTAEPGAGKTTRVPPALVDDGPVILLQPRRIAARAIAQRIADERGWAVGREIGWQIRFERRFGPETRLLVATEGILTARLQQDPLLSAFRTIVLDEFHERSIHADLAIALAKQAWRARPELRIAVMSATLDAASVSRFLDGCPVVSVPGRLHPLDVGYAPDRPVAQAAVDLLQSTAGDLLCFLPGALEIRSAMSDLKARAGDEVEIVPLYGTLDAGDQDRALRDSPSGRRRIVVATNIAETSLTVPRVTGVVDSGLHKVARYDAGRAIDSLETERITQDSADQRAGRAGRIAPGVACRLWDPRDRLRPHREPEIHRVDLSSAVLDVIAWGGRPRDLEWFDPPRAEAIDAASALLERLQAVKSGKLTEIGRQMRRLPLHPRLARMLVAAGGAPEMAQACALLSERHFVAARSASTTSDLLSEVDAWASVPPHVQRIAREIEQLASGALGFREQDPRDTRRRRPEPLSDAGFRRAVLAGYPDRVARRREPGSTRVKLASGAGAAIGSQSGVREGEFLIAIDLVSSRGSTHAPDALVRVASRVEREWLEATAVEVVHRFDDSAGVVRAVEVVRYDELILTERPTAPDPEIASRILADSWLERGPAEEDARLLRRIRFAGQTIDVADAVRAAAYGARSLRELQLNRALSPEFLRAVDRDAPETLSVPSGRAVRLEYGDDGVTASVKLQELFGLVDTPRIGPRREPVLFALLAPNGRPVQMTRDLRSFWERTYPEVRKELRGRYPRHPWPEDPWNATPTARATPRRRT
jgi:ATP-dependent helicase HrpB